MFGVGGGGSAVCVCVLCLCLGLGVFGDWFCSFLAVSLFLSLFFFEDISGGLCLYCVFGRGVG